MFNCVYVYLLMPIRIVRRPDTFFVYNSFIYYIFYLPKLKISVCPSLYTVASRNLFTNFVAKWLWGTRLLWYLPLFDLGLAARCVWDHLVAAWQYVLVISAFFACASFHPSSSGFWFGGSVLIGSRDWDRNNFVHKKFKLLINFAQNCSFSFWQQLFLVCVCSKMHNSIVYQLLLSFVFF